MVLAYYGSNVSEAKLCHICFTVDEAPLSTTLKWINKTVYWNYFRSKVFRRCLHPLVRRFKLLEKWTFQECQYEGTSINGAIRGLTSNGFNVDLWCHDSIVAGIKSHLPHHIYPSIDALCDRIHSLSSSSAAIEQLSLTLAAKEPVVTFIRILDDPEPSHAVVVVGIDSSKVYVYDPASEMLDKPSYYNYDTFLQMWAGTQFTALVVKP